MDWSSHAYYEDRLEFVRSSLANFLAKYSSIGLNFEKIEDAEEKICTVYFIILHEVVKPCVPTNVRRYKIASLIDLTVTRVQPLLTNKGHQDRYINARFGLDLSFQILAALYETDGVILPKITNASHSAIKPAINHHLDWMRIKQKDYFPIFANSSFYFLLCKYLLK